DIETLLLLIFDNLGPVGSDELARTAGRFTTRVGFHFILTPVFQQRSGPRLEWRLRIRQAAAARAPDAFFSGFRAESGLSVAPPGRRRRGRCCPTASTTASAATPPASTTALASRLLAVLSRLLTLSSRSALTKNKYGQGEHQYCAHKKEDRKILHRP